MSSSGAGKDRLVRCVLDESISRRLPTSSTNAPFESSISIEETQLAVRDEAGGPYRLHLSRRIAPGMASEPSRTAIP